MDEKKYKQVAYDICEILADGFTGTSGIVEPYEPAEFEMGLTLAMAMYFKAQFPDELAEVCRLHGKSLESILEELDANSHKDDLITMRGFDL